MKLIRRTVLALVLGCLALFSVTASAQQTQGQASVSEWTYLLTVDYNLTLAEMIGSGKYDWASSDITENRFPITRRGVENIEAVLVGFDRAISSEEALRELDRLGFRPATLPELLALGAAWPEEQRKYPIIALGSVWWDLDGPHAPMLWNGSLGRLLRLGWRGPGWPPVYRFLAVRK